MQRADTEKRRADEDGRARVARMDPRRKAELGLHAKQHTRDLASHRSHAVVVLRHRRPLAGDMATHQICELFTNSDADGDLHFVLQVVCPHCQESLGLPAAECQMHISQKNRSFAFEPRKFPHWMPDHDRGIWVDEQSGQVYEVAGTIETLEAFRCPNPSCNLRYRIADNVLHAL
jgi:hypothetical protein